MREIETGTEGGEGIMNAIILCCAAYGIIFAVWEIGSWLFAK